MSHRTRWTHDLAAEREKQVGEDDYGSPIYDQVDVVGGDAGDPVPVRFRSGGTEYIRGETGERVQRSDTLVGRGQLADLIEEGDNLTLTPRQPDAEEIDDIEVVGIEPQYGRGAKVSTAIIELEGV